VSRPLLELLTSESFLALLAALTLALAIAAIVLPQRLDRAREGAITARVSPLWLLLSCAAFVVALFRAPEQSVSLVLLAAQIGLSVWMVYRHRRWPWVATLLAAALLGWCAVALAVYGLAGTVG
jgi:hypothetical protein